MKNSVPPTAKIAKDAKECVQECVSEFISFITSEAAERCQAEKRKTIGGEDILHALSQLGFEDYAETLKIHLAKLRLVSCHSNHLPSFSLQQHLRVADLCICPFYAERNFGLWSRTGGSCPPAADGRRVRTLRSVSDVRRGISKNSLPPTLLTFVRE